MGKYAYVKIEYYFISQVIKFVNRILKIFYKVVKNPSLRNGTRAVLIYPSRIHILFLLLRLCKQDV